MDASRIDGRTDGWMDQGIEFWRSESALTFGSLSTLKFCDSVSINRVVSSYLTALWDLPICTTIHMVSWRLLFNYLDSLRFLLRFTATLLTAEVDVTLEGRGSIWWRWCSTLCTA